jgi:hypothetical protein
MLPWVSWGAFQGSDPQLALLIRELLMQYGQGTAYLATVRRDGGPRVHPVSPIVAGHGLYCFVIASHKRSDLLRDGRYALHSFPAEASDAEAYLSGRARQVVNLSIVDRMAREHRAAAGVDWTLFELSIDVAMLHRYTPGTGAHVWRAPRARTRVLVAA